MMAGLEKKMRTKIEPITITGQLTSRLESASETAAIMKPVEQQSMNDKDLTEVGSQEDIDKK